MKPHLTSQLTQPTLPPTIVPELQITQPPSAKIEPPNWLLESHIGWCLNMVIKLQVPSVQENHRRKDGFKVERLPPLKSNPVADIWMKKITRCFIVEHFLSQNIGDHSGLNSQVSRRHRY